MTATLTPEQAALVQLAQLTKARTALARVHRQLGADEPVEVTLVGPGLWLVHYTSPRPRGSVRATDHVLVFDDVKLTRLTRATGALWRHDVDDRLVGQLHRGTGRDRGVLTPLVPATAFAAAQAIAERHLP